MTLYRRSIERIFNRDTGKDESASGLLNKLNDRDEYVKLRRLIRIRNKEKNFLYQCSECGTELELSCIPDGIGDHTFYFKHIRDPKFDKCSIKTDSNLSKEEIQRRQYAFKSESNAHILLKQKAGEIIRLFIYPEVIIDKKFISSKFGDKEKRKPDIYFKLGDHEITIEFQINNTFHSIIQEREAFYERNKISLIWVFGEFDPSAFQSITIKDIYIPNGNNAFVFDAEAEQASYVQKTLCFKVFYKKYSFKDGNVQSDWVNELINIHQIFFNPITLRPYYFDSEKDKLRTEKEYEEILVGIELESLRNTTIDNAHKFRQFLSSFRKNDTLTIGKYQDVIDNLNAFESEIYNQLLNLQKRMDDGSNVIQKLLQDKNHYNLIAFLMRSSKLILPLQSVSNNNETTLISLIQSPYHTETLIQLLFSRGYKINRLDVNFIKTKYQPLEQKRYFYLYKNYEILSSYNLIDFFYDNLNQFLVIESAKNRKLTIIGNESQTLLWMANLAADKFQKFWYYFDKAFSFYRLYDILTLMDKNGSFKNNLLKLATTVHSRHQTFEDILSILYPELIAEKLNTR